MKITIDVKYPEQFNFANVEVLFPSGNTYSVNGYKIVSVKGKTVEILCFQHNYKLGTIKKRIKLNDNGNVTFKFNRNREFLIGTWKEV